MSSSDILMVTYLASLYFRSMFREPKHHFCLALYVEALIDIRIDIRIVVTLFCTLLSCIDTHRTNVNKWLFLSKWCIVYMWMYGISYHVTIHMILVAWNQMSTIVLITNTLVSQSLPTLSKQPACEDLVVSCKIHISNMLLSRRHYNEGNLLLCQNMA